MRPGPRRQESPPWLAALILVAAAAYLAHGFITAPWETFITAVLGAAVLALAAMAMQLFGGGHHV